MQIKKMDWESNFSILFYIQIEFIPLIDLFVQVSDAPINCNKYVIDVTGGPE